MDIQKEYDIQKNEFCCDICETFKHYDPIDRVKVLDECFKKVYNLGKKHSSGNDGMIKVPIGVVKTMYGEAKKATNSTNPDERVYGFNRINLLETLYGKDNFPNVERIGKYLEESKNTLAFPSGETYMLDPRLQVAMAAMQGMASEWYHSRYINGSIDYLVEQSVKIADALIAEVNKKGGNE